MAPTLAEVALLLFQMAWADGEVQSAEVVLISTLLEQLGMPLAERLALMDQALSQPPPAGLGVAGGETAHPAVMQLLVRLCFVDQKASPGELAILGELADRWGISAAQLEQFRQAAR